MLKRKSGTALWQQIGEQLAAEITDGTMPPGTRLPTEPELVERFGVSRNTVRRAMSTLEEGGLVRVEQGRGTFVHDDVIYYEISKRTRYSRNLLHQGRDPTTKVEKTIEVPATDHVAAMLKIRRNEMVIVASAYAMADEVIISVGEMYYPSARFPGLLKRRHRTLSQAALFASYGIDDYTRLTTWISARPPTDAEARRLRQPRSRWVIVTQKVDVDAKGKPVCYAESLWSADRIQFVVNSSSDANHDADG